MIDTEFKYAQWSTNVNTSGMNWQTYHEGKWYNPAEQTYSQAVDELKETIRQKVLSDHPHLIAFDKQEDRVDLDSALRKVSDKQRIIKTPTERPPSSLSYTEKTNKGTIEEQIEACVSELDLESFRMLANMNPKLKELFQKKLAELQKQTSQ